MEVALRKLFEFLLLALLATLLPSSAWAQAESPTKFCWKETRVTDASKTVIPEVCGASQERNGLFCYEKCRPGFTSNRIDGCVQNCPAGAQDEGLFCAWPSYKAAEYPLWDEQVCKGKHAGGCWKSGLLWVENCKLGYKHVLGFCEKEDISCQQLGLAGNRVANSCAKQFYTRPPQQAGCKTGTEFSAGLCYAECGTSADRVGFVCWSKCPPGWVNCGMGCAKSEADCKAAIVDQVVSVVDAVASTTLLIGSLGASAATSNIMSKAAWQGIKKIGKVAVKDVLKTTAASVALQTPGNIANIANGTVDYIWNIGAIQDNTVMTETEKAHAIANLALSSVAMFDPTGVTGVVSAYNKPICKDIAAAHPVVAPPAASGTASAGTGSTAAVTANLQSLARQGEVLNTRLQQERESAVKLMREQLAKTSDATARKSLEARIADAQRELVQGIQDMASSKAMQATAGEWARMPPLVPLAPAPAVSAVKVWRQLPGAAEDIGAGANDAIWVIGTNKVPGGFGIYRWTGSAWANIPGGAVRIDVDAQGNAWVVNDTGAVFRYTGSGWSTLPGNAKDVGVGGNGTAWVVGSNAVPGGFGIYRWTGSAWTNIPGGAVRIDVDPQGNAWVVNDGGGVFRYTGSGWIDVPGIKARDVGIGADGSVFVLDSNGGVHKWSGSAWLKRDGTLKEISVDAKGVPVGVNAGKQIWTGYP